MPKDISSATNILFDNEIPKFGVDMLVNMDNKKSEIASDLNNRYSTKNNPLIKKDVIFDKNIPITMQGRLGALGQFMGDEISLTNKENDYKSNDDTWESTLRHELRHSNSYNVFMNSDNYQTIQKHIPYKKDNLAYYRDPDEVESRLYQIRNNSDIGVKDRNIDDITRKLDQYLNKGVNLKPFNDLLKVTDKETIIKLLKEVASTSNSNNTKNIT